MSVIQTQAQNWPVYSKEDVIALYKGALDNPDLPGGQVSKIGMELELNLYNVDDVSPLSEEGSQRFICEGKSKAIIINHEPSASTLEILTDPFAKDDFDKLLTQMNQRFDELWALGLERGALPSPFGYFPHITPAQHHLTHNERYITFWIPPRADMVSAFESFLDPSIQVSISYRNPEHLLQIIRLSVALESFMILTTEADAGFYEGTRINGSPRTKILKRRGRNGGIPDFYFTAKSGEELIDAHIDYTMHNPHLFACFNHEGVLGKLPEGIWASFAELEAQNFGPQDLLNYRQAQSESWRRTTNISEIRDEDGTLFGHRAEISSLFCSGLQHQRVSGSILSFLLSYCSNFYNDINDLMIGFGIDLCDLEGCKGLLEQNFEAAHNHGGRYYDLPFGNKTLKDFALSFSEIIQHCLKDSMLQQYSAPLMHILTEGRPDWLVNREIFENLEQQKSYMRALPDLAAAHPALISADSCADFTKDVVKGFLKQERVA